MPDRSSDREQWGSRVGFILATVGSAVGLGNVWRFPTIVARSGGGAFLLLYMGIVLLIGIPLMMAELAMGRRSGRGVVGAFRSLQPGRGWWLGGIVAAAAVFFILSYYSVIAGWTLVYTSFGAAGDLQGLDVEGLEQLFAQVTGGTLLPVAGQILFIVLSSGVVYFGVTDGIERWGKILIPSIVILLLLLLGRVLFLPGAIDGVMWFLRPDFGRLSLGVALEAMGQVFFSFSLGMGAVLTYGSYLSRDDDISRNSFVITLADVAIAVLAGLVVISALHAFDIDPEVGFGLVFVALPAVFNTLAFSPFWNAVFFVSLAFAAMTSLISFLEVLNAIFMEEFGWSRRRVVPMVGTAIILVGLPSALAQGALAQVILFDRDIMDAVDALTSSVILPLSGLITVLYVGWVWGAGAAAREIAGDRVDSPFIHVWIFIVRYVAPAALVYIFLAGIAT